MSLCDALVEGSKAWDDGARREECPYEGGWQREAWLDGWDYADMVDED